MSNVFCFEQGNSRGHEFTNRYIFDKVELIEAIEYSIVIMKSMSDDEKDDYFDKISDKFDGVLLLLVNGSDFIDDDDQLTVGQRLNNIKTNQTFQIECEESVFGFASNKRDAKANAYFVDNGDDW